MQKRKIYLASFASFNFHPASFRFYNQALDMGIFENIFIYNETNLDMDYKRHFKDKIYIESNLQDSKDSIKMHENIESKSQDSRIDSKDSNKEFIESNAQDSKVDSKDSIESSSQNAKKDSIESNPYTMQNYYHKSSCLPQDSKTKFTRGYGYWSWKPQVVLQTLEKLENGDILLYIDVGCHLIPNKAQNLLEKLEILENHDIVGFKSAIPCHNRQYTKASVLAHFGYLNNEQVINDRQIKGGVFFCKKSEKTLQFMREWRQVIWEHFEFVDDSESSLPNVSGFLEHRHDQSIFDLLMRKYDCYTFTDYHDHSGTNDSFGILDKRAKINMNLRNKPLVLKILNAMGKWFPIRSVRKDVREIVKMVNG